jgi:glycosyltransferase involved in cell wall biosynthesis
MHLFIIPSWYPYPDVPNAGIFFKEQAESISCLRPAWQVGVSLWGQGQHRISMRHPRNSLRILHDGLPRDGERVVSSDECPNMKEYRELAFEWTPRVLQGNRDALADANRKNFMRAMRDIGPIDLIHAHVSYPAGWIAMKVREEFGVPFVLTEHMGPFPFPSYLDRHGGLRPFVREPLQRAEVVIAVSSFQAERIASFGLPRPVVVPNMVDERLFNTEGRTRSPGDTPVTFFTLCSMVPGKGIEDLLSAIARVIARIGSGKKPCFVIGGDGPELLRYKKRASALRIDRVITWRGRMTREQVAAQHKASDCFVLPSHYESFGVSYVEALSCGTPVIATQHGGTIDFVTDANGILVAPRDVEQIATALEVMLLRRRSYPPKELSRNALARFSRGAVVGLLEDVYRTLSVALRSPVGMRKHR